MGCRSPQAGALGGLEADRRPDFQRYSGQGQLLPPNLCPQLEPPLHSYSLCIAPVSVHLSVIHLCTYWSVLRGL